MLERIADKGPDQNREVSGPTRVMRVESHSDPATRMSAEVHPQESNAPLWGWAPDSEGSNTVPESKTTTPERTAPRRRTPLIRVGANDQPPESFQLVQGQAPIEQGQT